MKWTIALMLIATYCQTLALRCETCKGAACQSNDVPITKCSKVLFDLPPHATNVNVLAEEGEYQCVEADISEGGITQKIKQCYSFHFGNVVEDDEQTYSMEEEEFMKFKAPVEKTPVAKAPVAKAPLEKAALEKAALEKADDNLGSIWDGSGSGSGDGSDGSSAIEIFTLLIFVMVAISKLI